MYINKLKAEKYFLIWDTFVIRSDSYASLRISWQNVIAIFLQSLSFPLQETI